MDLLRRVRWGNVARAAALLVAVALVLAWPQLRSDPPPLPPEPALAAPAPVREQSAEFGLEPPAAKPRATSGGKARRATSRARPKRRRATPRRATTPRRVEPGGGPRTRRGADSVGVAPRSAAPVWTPAPPQSEFGLGE